MSDKQEGSIILDSVVQHEVIQSEAHLNEDQSSVVDDSIVAGKSGLQAPSVQANSLPVPDGCIEPLRAPSEISPDPYLLPSDLELEWSSIDLMNDAQLDELQTFLCENYVEDEEDGAFRMRYSAEFLRWALCPPGYHPDWHIAVRAKSDGQIVAFVSSVPITVRVRNNILTAREMNFLCVHKTMRGKRLTPLLISEATRRAQLKGANYNLWTTGTSFPNQISACRYYHRILNAAKLVDVGFRQLGRGQTVDDVVEENALPEKELPLVDGLRAMEERDVSEVAALYGAYMRRFDLALVFTPEEIKHHLLGSVKQGFVPRERFVWAYVVEDPVTEAITDFFSFFSTPYSILTPNSGQHQSLNIAYLYFYATEVAMKGTDEGLRERLNLLMEDAVYLTKEHGFDVFNALTLMDNPKFMKNLKFAGGNGILKYYLDNWRTAPLAGLDSVGDVPAGMGIGVVML